MRAAQTTRPVRIAATVAALSVSLTGAEVAAVTQAPIVGELERLSVDASGGLYAGGVMVVGGQNVTLPRNLLVDLPGTRLTLRQLFDDAPPHCAGTSGLARADPCRGGTAGAIATVLANRLDTGEVIAGDVSLVKGLEVVVGDVTFLDHAGGSFRLNGLPGDAATGLLVRLNDPEARHTVQRGPGCAGGPNCSPDPRFGVDPDDYTAAFVTGVPVCLPSTVVTGARTAGSDLSGSGDPLCPQHNRDTRPMADSTRFAPLRVGDNVRVEGGWESVGGVRFLSAWRLQVRDALLTRDEPGQPDYLLLAGNEWDVPGFSHERLRFLLVGASSLASSRVDVFGRHFDVNGHAHERPVASTVGNPGTIHQGMSSTAGGLFELRYDVDFLAGVDPLASPCGNLRNAGFHVCPLGPTLADEVRVLSPTPRELVARTRRVVPLSPGVIALDVSGRPAPSGEYRSSVGLGHPDFGAFDLARVRFPFLFDGLPWNLDRRLGPGGCDGLCEASPQPLEPFPFAGLDPRTQSANPLPDRMFAFHPFGPGDAVDWPPPTPTPFGVTATPEPAPLCALPEPPEPPTISSFGPTHAAAGASGTGLVHGAGFVAGTTCALGSGVDVACEVLSSSRLRAVFRVSPLASPGLRTLVVTGPGGSASLAAAFTVEPPPPRPTAPLLVDVFPVNVTPGTTYALALTGEGFTPGMACAFGPGVQVLECHVLSATAAIASVSVGADAAFGFRLGTVTSADGLSGSLASALCVVSSGPPAVGAPTITAVSPYDGAQGTSVVATLSGTGFLAGATCLFGPGVTVVSCGVLSPTTAIAALEIDPAAGPGHRDVTLVNPDFQGATLASGFEVLEAGPTQPPAPPLPPAPPDFGTTLFADSFDAFDSADLGPHWSVAGRFYRRAARARGESALGLALAQVPAPDAQAAQARVYLTGTADGSGVVVRASFSGWYAARLRSSGAIEIVRVDGASTTVLGTRPMPVVVNSGYTLRLTVTGSDHVRLDASVDGVVVLTAGDPDAARRTSGLAGLLSGSAARTQFDSFQVRIP